MGSEEMIGIIGYKVIMGVVIGLVIAGIILFAKYAIPKKAAALYAFEQFEDAPTDKKSAVAAPSSSDKKTTVEKLREAIRTFQQDLLLIRVCARETCGITKVLEDLFAKNLATLDANLNDLPVELKSKWEKYREKGASGAFKLYMKDYSWTNNKIQLLECFEGDELTALVKQIDAAGNSKEFKEALQLFKIIKNTLKFNDTFLSQMKVATDAIKSVAVTSMTSEGFTSQINDAATMQLEALSRFHKAVEVLQKEVDTQKDLLIDIVKTITPITP
jgi:hypothetical protein